MEKRKSLKNGKIEFYRFIFSLYVLLFHAGKYIFGEPSLKEGIHLSFFPHGSMGVEFFFVLSGFFLAKDAYKHYCDKKGSDESLSSEYAMFMKKKYLRIFPQHFIAFVLVFIIYSIVNKFNIKQLILLVYKSIPNIFLIQMSGISFVNINHVEWYISCMFIAFAIIYPLCRRYYYRFTRYYAPLLSLLTFGYMIYTTSSLTGVAVWMGISYKSVFRAVAEVAIGTTAYEVSRVIKKYFETNKSGQLQLGLTVLELFAFVYITIYVLFTFEKKYEIYVVFAAVLMVAIAFCGISYGSKLFDCKLVYFLGELSFPIYLTQLGAIYLVQDNYAGTVKGCISVVVLTFAFALVVMAVEKAGKNFLQRLSVN